MEEEVKDSTFYWLSINKKKDGEEPTGWEPTPTFPKKNALKKSLFRVTLNGGGSGIRTHGTREGTTVFKTAPINRSGTPPYDCSDVILLY